MIICVDHIVQFDDSSDEILEATSLATLLETTLTLVGGAAIQYLKSTIPDV